jgi:hypothetical protein
MNTSSRQIHIQALVDEDIEENLISQLFAVRHGLEIGPLHEAEEGTSVEFDDASMEECIGAVGIQWSPERGSLKSFSIRCLVLEHKVRGVIFGTRFVNKRDQYRRLGSLRIREAWQGLDGMVKTSQESELLHA